MADSELSWQDRALRAATSILDTAAVPLAPPDETRTIRLMAIAWMHGVQVGSDAALESAEAAIAEITARL